MGILVVDVMTKGVHSVSPDTSLFELERVLIDSKLGGAPVTEGDKLVGVVSRTDIVRRLLAEHEFRDYAEFEHRQTVSGLDIPLDDLWPSAERGLDRTIQTRLRLLHVRDIMAEHPVTVPAGAPLEVAGKIMLERHIHRVIVVEGERPVGIVTALDIVRCYCDPP